MDSCCVCACREAGRPRSNGGCLDELSEKLSLPSLRLTTRQTFQFHGILKGNVKPLIQGMHKVLLDSIAACGDVNRNVMAPPNPERDPILQRVYEDARSWSEFALPKTRAYHEIWLDEELVAGGRAGVRADLRARPTCLANSRRPLRCLRPMTSTSFRRISVSLPLSEDGQLAGYNVTVGGGMGMNHGNVETFPRLADVLGFIPAPAVNAVGRAVLITQRDYGDRTNRRHARLKYTIEDRGIDWFKAEVERLSGVTFAPARDFEFSTIQDPHGWHECADGTWFYGLHILSGRIKDLPGWPMKTALREIAQVHTGDFRLTPSQNLTISGVTAAQKPVIEAILARHGLTSENERSGIALNALSCVALPTCGLALTESERVLPDILNKFEAVFEEAGLREDAISLRITGCPNGCARPFLGEIGFVGRAPEQICALSWRKLQRHAAQPARLAEHHPRRCLGASQAQSSNAMLSSETKRRASATFVTGWFFRRTLRSTASARRTTLPSLRPH